MALTGSWWPWRRAQAAVPPRWVVVDVETTGLDPARDALLAIAAVAIHWRDGEPQLVPLDRFECLVRPARDPSAVPDEGNILVHRIGVGRQAAGLEPRQALADWTVWLGDAPVLAYHAPFDQAVLTQAARRAGVSASPNPWVDLADVVTLIDPAVRGGLDAWLSRHGIRCRQRHRALADAWATAELFLALWPALRSRGLTDWPRLQRSAQQQAWLRRTGQLR